MSSMHRECARIIGPCVHPKALLIELATVLQHLAARLESVVRSRRRDYEFGYRSIPFEKIADDYAKRLMPEVLAALVAKD